MRSTSWSQYQCITTHHEKTAQTMPTILLVSEGMERDLQQPQQPPTAEKVT
jgi:hypothetical protein